PPDMCEATRRVGRETASRLYTVINLDAASSKRTLSRRVIQRIRGRDETATNRRASPVVTVRHAPAGNAVVHRRTGGGGSGVRTRLWQRARRGEGGGAGSGVRAAGVGGGGGGLWRARAGRGRGARTARAPP